MTSSARTSISALPRGFEFEPARFSLSADDVSAYLRAVGDENDYGDAVPPLAAIALGLASLQEQISLPEGSLHTGQEAEHRRLVRVAEQLRLTGRIAQRSERQGAVISVIAFEISGERGPALEARTTIIVPGGAE